MKGTIRAPESDDIANSGRVSFGFSGVRCPTIGPYGEIHFWLASEAFCPMSH